MGLLFALLTTAANAQAPWPQWGGPGRDFHAPASDVADRWPAGGLEQLWRQPLGAGYSSIVADSERVYTHYRDGDNEIIAAFRQADGVPAWSHRYSAPHRDGMRMGYGVGPHATPLLADGRLFAVGVTGKLFALEAATGRVLWHVDLWNDLAGTFLRRGYAASPIAYGQNILVTVGGKGQGVIAFDAASGTVRWKAQDFDNSQSSPLLIEVGSRTQLVVFVNDQIAGLDPASGGTLLWRHPHKSTAAYNITTPVWDGQAARLFLTSAYGGGSRALDLRWDAEGATATERFATPRLKVHYTNTVRVGDHVYGSSGNTGRILLSALDLDTGEVVWKERRIGRANLLVVGDRVLTLETDGKLSWTSLDPSGLTIHAATQLIDGPTWTVPTLIGKTLFVRDEKHLTAFLLPPAVAKTDDAP